MPLPATVVMTPCGVTCDPIVTRSAMKIADASAATPQGRYYVREDSVERSRRPHHR